MSSYLQTHHILPIQRPAAQRAGTRTRWQARLGLACAWALGLGMGCGMAQAQSGRGLTLDGTQTETTWPHWGGRLGMVLGGSESSNPAALNTAADMGLKVHSMHLLSDYYFSGGFRATAGLLRGATNLPWGLGSTPEEGVSLSLLRVDLLGQGMSASSVALSDDPYRTVPYLGAGYSGKFSQAPGWSAWRFNADLGVISLNSQNIGRIGRVLQGDKGVEDLLRELRLRPVVKVNVNYAF
jgi:hypothetical protein